MRLVLKDLEQAEKRAIARQAVSANRAKWKEDEEVLDIAGESRIREDFEGINDIHVAITLGEKLKKRYQNDPAVIEDRRQKLFAMIDAQVEAVFERALKIDSKKNKKKNVSPYEDD